ncbi:MAG: hypothetical protein V1647_03895 [Pseudomonadota bacterium]
MNTLILAALGVYGQENVWHTAGSDRFDYSQSITDEETKQIASHPIYKELEEEKDIYKIKHFELTTGIIATQMKQNVSDAVVVGSNNMFPTVRIQAALWPLSWLGMEATWDKSIIVSLGAKQDPATPNSVLMSPYWVDAGAKLRYLLSNVDNTSFYALRIGYHHHSFPIITYPQYISKSTATGIYLGGERKIAFNNRFGLDFNFDFLWLSKLLDSSAIPNAQKGIGYRFSVDFYATVTDSSNLNTLISLGYGQISYISNLTGNGVAGDSRSILNANHFEQTYNNIHLTFTARL